MGVPKFYRWISERYPKINQIITDSALLPEFDHLYLDMNGIIHGCTHPSHLDISEVLSERDMMLGIMHYIDRIVTQIVRPKVSLYMAIDGVAPRAKLNQQRSRRFRSARDLAEEQAKIANKSSAETSDNNSPTKVFDSNCITPGTEFMCRVSDTIRYFIRKKLKEDPLWKDLRVVFSGHDVPGEGEHKIMSHIRHMKSQPGYRPNTRHCMYGQDADLIMLGLVTHEPHFTLLREVIDFGFSSSKDKNVLKTVQRFTKKSDFQLLHLSILREYIDIDFGRDDEDSSLERKYDLERCIDDFVFLTFLVGNDFLPHLPTLDIGEHAFDLLFRVYKERRRKWISPDGKNPQYLTFRGDIADASRLEEFLAVVGQAETEIFEKRKADEEHYQKKKRRNDKRGGLGDSLPSEGELQAIELELQKTYADMIQSLSSTKSKETEEAALENSQHDFKGRYYFEKLHLKPTDTSEHYALRKCYVEGLLWCLAYYYRGCVSWGWFFPYHYGPLLSDLIDLPRMFNEIKFEKGAPLKPFEQLMGCLPPASSSIVPAPYRRLMHSSDSPILHFYPQTFEVDMNGKRNPWEGVNLLPFIDIKLLRETIQTKCPDNVLTPDERIRNQRGKVLLFRHDLTSTETVPSFNPSIGIRDIMNCHSRVESFDDPPDGFDSFEPVLVKGTEIPFPGFPSLNVIPISKTELVSGLGLNCFGSNSKYRSVLISLHSLPQALDLDQVASRVLGSYLFVNWPMMHEAKVLALSNSEKEIRLISPRKGGKKQKGDTANKYKVKQFTNPQKKSWADLASKTRTHHCSGMGVPGTGGVDIGTVSILLKVVLLQGMRVNAVDGSTCKVWGSDETEIPLQMALFRAPAPDPRFVEKGPMALHSRFPVGGRVVLTKGKYRGCIATVLGVVDSEQNSDKKPKPRLGLSIKTEALGEPAFGRAIAQAIQDVYVSVADACRVLQMKTHVFSRLCGNVSFDPGRYDLGLNLTSRDGRYVAGYSRAIRVDDNDNDHNNTTHDSNRNKGDVKTKGAWQSRDTVRILSSRDAPTDNGQNQQNPKFTWEYTAKAVRVMGSYRAQFPELFHYMNQNPHERYYEASKVFSNQSKLSEIRRWLDNSPAAKIPRTPYWTTAMSAEAIVAVQKAADVRRSAQAAAMEKKEINVKVPPSSVLLEGAHKPTEVAPILDNRNPDLGVRIVNLCADGVPFGARGTVVAIHDDPRKGYTAAPVCVEVVMDEEFLGGSNLQGSCRSHRGKLCPWAHLMAIEESVPQSKDQQQQSQLQSQSGVIHQKNSDHKQIQSILLRERKGFEETNNSTFVATHRINSSSNISRSHGSRPEPTSKQPQPKPYQSNGSNSNPITLPRQRSPLPHAVVSPNLKVQKHLSTPRTPPPPHTRPLAANLISSATALPNVTSSGVNRNVKRSSPKRVTITPTRNNNNNGTTPGRKQGAWREAKGPEADGIGFRNIHLYYSTTTNNKGSGFQAWKELVSSRDEMSPCTAQAIHIKTPSIPDKEATLDAVSAGLKAILGVTSTTATTTMNDENKMTEPDVTIPINRSNSNDDATAMLKSKLGLGGFSAAALTPSALLIPQPPKEARMTAITTTTTIGTTTDDRSSAVVSALSDLILETTNQDALELSTLSSNGNLQSLNKFNFSYVPKISSKDDSINECDIEEEPLTTANPMP